MIVEHFDNLAQVVQSNYVIALTVTCGKPVQGVSHQSFAKCVALINEDFNTVWQNVIDILVSKSSNRVDELVLVRLIAFKVFLLYHLHGRNI